MTRLDQVLVERGFYDSREKAKRAILAGQVRVNDQRALKASQPVKETDRIEVLAGEKYVSRGGQKLEGALTDFELDVAGAVALDLGASTGGFTDCLLQHGAARVCAVDVGRGQLAWKLRQDARVTVLEKTNARHLRREALPEPFKEATLIVIDCSFISLRNILPSAVALLSGSGRILALIKPQFEAGKEEADRGAGVIRDAAIHQRVLKELEEFASSLPGVRWIGVRESHLIGPAGNKEFFVLLEKTCTES